MKGLTPSRFDAFKGALVGTFHVPSTRNLGKDLTADGTAERACYYCADGTAERACYYCRLRFLGPEISH